MGHRNKTLKIKRMAILNLPFFFNTFLDKKIYLNVDQKQLQNFIKQNQDFFDVKTIGKSVLGKNIYSLNKEYSPNYKWCIVIAGIHAREHLSCDLVCHLAKKLKSLPKQDFNISFVPLANPDGADFVNNGISKYSFPIQQKLITINGGRDFSLFKANANGVDLNNNFDANWKNHFSKIFKPSSQGYYGTHPESEPETQAIVRWTRKLNPFLAMSFHLKGEEIYFDFFQSPREFLRDKKIAKVFAKSSGYKIKSTQKTSSGGYKDWCVSHLKIPALTIELGSNKFSHPFPKSQLENICETHKNFFKNIEKSLKIYEKYTKFR